MISEYGKQLLRNFEGLRLSAYRCQANVLTIGYGHTKSVKVNDVITKEQAEKFLEEDIEACERVIKKYVKVELNQNQRDAITSFIFNFGEKKFASSTLLKFLNQGHFPLAAGQFDRWIYAGGKVSNGLIKRRKQEKELFLKPIS